MSCAEEMGYTRCPTHVGLSASLEIDNGRTKLLAAGIKLEKLGTDYNVWRTKRYERGEGGGVT